MTGATGSAAIQVYLMEMTRAAVRDISQSGMALETRAPLGIGVEYVFRLESEGTPLLLRGQVARVNLAELAESEDSGRVTIYHNGVVFRIDRRPEDAALMALIRDSAMNEKRLAPIRVRPAGGLSAAVARDVFQRVIDLDEAGVSLTASSLPDMDRTWRLLVCAGGDSRWISGRFGMASRKDGADLYSIRFVFEDDEDGARRFLGNAASLWKNEA